MSRMLTILLGGLIAATPLYSHAEIYKCTINGSVTFSDIPCTNNAKPIEVNVYIPPEDIVTKANQQTQDIEQGLATSKRLRQIDTLQREIETKKLKRDNELRALRTKKGLAANNLAGATWENSISAEMQAVTIRYQGEIDALNSQIAALQPK
ncbi:hypothetical protein KAM348_07160 [Aeromonas caviae]|uniref:DUF4124 domain-containing protein n=1 Tax=Aeromonas caviae TaxID=648 RepID=A0AAI9P8L3_AERCA|nr:DUF4124 domain-containing protein [Aeromonas caviae]GJA53293.1 hypothetical protein KAM348_07160 [Aeromonas caviae]